MKKTMLLALWLPLIAITFFTSCKKSSSLPTGPYQIRAYDNNYQFGGTLNGSEFVPFTQGGWFGVDPIEARVRLGSNNTQNFQFNIRRLDYEGVVWKKWYEIELFIEDFKGTGIYKLNSQTNFYGFTTTPKSYGGFTSRTDYTGNEKYYLTNNLDTGYINCKRWNASNDFEFEFNYTCRNSTVGDPDRSTKTIEGTVIKKP